MLEDYYSVSDLEKFGTGRKQNAEMKRPKGKVYEFDLGIQRREFTTPGMLSQLSSILNVSVHPDPKATQVPKQVRKQSFICK